MIGNWPSCSNFFRSPAINAGKLTASNTNIP